MNIQIGADPEVFLKRGGDFVNAFGLIPGTKYEPHKVDKGAVEVDGMAAEFLIEPATSSEEFEGNITTVMSILLSMTDGCEFDDASSVHFTEQFFADQPEESKILGCSPDFNAYTEDANFPPDASTLMRTVGGHIHVGGFPTSDMFSDEHLEKCFRVIKMMDICLGLPSLFWDDDTKRRLLYGKAGAMRPKPYGVEYRTLSNAWIFEKHLRKIVFDQSVRATELGLSDLELFSDEDIPSIIDKSDKEKAKNFIEKNIPFYTDHCMEFLNEKF